MLTLATLEIKAEGKTIAFASKTPTITVPDTGLAIRLSQPVELKNLANEAARKFAWDKVTGSIDLLQQTDGSWRGRFFAADRPCELALEPAKEK